MKILIINLKHLGDVLTTTPLLPALRHHFPRCRIAYLVRAAMEPMVEDHPMVEQILVLNPLQGGPLALARFHLQFLRRLRREHFDLVLDLSHGDRGAFLTLVTRAPMRVGYDSRGAGFLGRNRVYTHLVRTDGDHKHAIEFNLDALRVIGIDPLGSQMSFHWSNAAGEEADEILARVGLGLDDSFVVIHPTSRWMFKTWTAEGYAKVSDHIQEHYGCKVVITSGPNPREVEKVEQICSLLRHPVVNLSGQVSLKHLGRIIQRAVLFFGVDSAPMHMAVALNTPALVLFGPSGEHMWGPLGGRHRVITLPFACRPCGRDGCEGSKRSRCLEEINPLEVTRCLEEMLSEMKLKKVSAGIGSNAPVDTSS
jgi:heptosyltransferase-3